MNDQRGDAAVSVSFGDGGLESGAHRLAQRIHRRFVKVDDADVVNTRKRYDLVHVLGDL